MRHLRETPQANQESAIWVWIEYFQRSQQSVPGIFHCPCPNRSLVAQRIRGRRHGFCNLQFHPLLGAKCIDLQTVGEFYSASALCEFIVAGIEAPRLPISDNINVWILWEKEVDIRREPCPVATRILPDVTGVVAASGLRAVQR